MTALARRPIMEKGNDSYYPNWSNSQNITVFIQDQVLDSRRAVRGARDRDPVPGSEKRSWALLSGCFSVRQCASLQNAPLNLFFLPRQRKKLRYPKPEKPEAERKREGEKKIFLTKGAWQKL